MKELNSKTNKKMIFGIISLVVAFFSLFTICLGVYSQKTDDYIFYIINESNGLSVNEIKIGDSNVDLNRYNYKNSKYDKNKNEIVLSSKDDYIIKKSRIDNLKVSFKNKSNIKKDIVVKKNGKEVKKINIKSNSTYVYMDNVSTFTIITYIINNLSFVQVVFIIIIFFIFYLLIYLSILYINNFVVAVKKNSFSLTNYVISMLLLLFINLLYMFPLMQFNKFISILPMITSLFIIVYNFRKSCNTELQNYYIVISMFIGVIFLLIFPPLHVPDESSHMIKSYQNSYVFQNNHEITKDATYAYLPKNMNEFISKYGEETLNYDFRMHPRTYTYDLLRLTDYNDRSNYYTWYALKYTSSITYLPGTLVAIFAKITKMPLLLFNYLSKIFTYIISTIMCYYAIKLTPKFKKIFFIVPLLPIFIQQSFGFNVDWLTNSTFILLLAFILKGIYQNEKMNRSDIFKIMILSITLGFCKFGYFPIALLFLLIPTFKNHNLRDKSNLYKILIILVIVIVPILVTSFFRFYSSFTYAYNGVKTVSTRSVIPLSALWTNPKMIISMLIQTFIIRLDLDLFRGLTTGFGWSTIWSNSLFIFISLLLLMTVILCHDENNIKLSLKQKIVFFVSFILICGLIYGAMLFGWTEIGSKSIDGLQPRYFIPPIMLLYILLQNKFILVNIKNKELFYAISMIIINVLGLITILAKVYV